jgi:hypothetical protein
MLQNFGGIYNSFERADCYWHYEHMYGCGIFSAVPSNEVNGKQSSDNGCVHTVKEHSVKEISTQKTRAVSLKLF